MRRIELPESLPSHINSQSLEPLAVVSHAIHTVAPLKWGFTESFSPELLSVASSECVHLS